MGGRGLQKNPECVKKTELKHKTLYCPNEFVHDCSYICSLNLVHVRNNSYSSAKKGAKVKTFTADSRSG